MARRRTLEQWRVVVFSAPVPDSVRVYLLKLADHMDARRFVSVPRKRIADELGKHESRIAERTKAAIDAGLLTCVSPGRKGHTAVYQGLFPDAVTTSKGTEIRYPIEDAKGTSARYAKSGHRVREIGTPVVSPRLPERSLLGWLPNEGMEEETQPNGSSTEVHRRAVPGWDREESA